MRDPAGTGPFDAATIPEAVRPAGGCSGVSRWPDGRASNIGPCPGSTAARGAATRGTAAAERGGRAPKRARRAGTGNPGELGSTGRENGSAAEGAGPCGKEVRGRRGHQPADEVAPAKDGVAGLARSNAGAGRPPAPDASSRPRPRVIAAARRRSLQLRSARLPTHTSRTSRPPNLLDSGALVVGGRLSRGGHLHHTYCVRVITRWRCVSFALLRSP